MTRILTWGSFFAGLVFWTAAAGVVSAAFAWVYNRVVERVRIPTVERERVRV